MKNYNGPRSKFSMLPHQIRWRVYNLLSDGATLKALLADPEVSAALAKAGTTLSSANLAGIRKVSIFPTKTFLYNFFHKRN